MEPVDVVVVGGGAAGFFGAIRCAERNPRLRVMILEQGANVLSKVRISGGGRCNLTHACYDPAELTGFFPRGGRELRGAFTRFQPRDTLAWFVARGVNHKVEDDGRVFPVSDSSQTVIDCLIRAAVEAGVEIRTKMGVKTMEIDAGGGGFRVQTVREGPIECRKVLVATGGSPAAFPWLHRLGHAIQLPVPSLFTFNIRDPRLAGLAGVSVERVRVSLPGPRITQEGALLVTHWGLSGPAVLKLSAWGARTLHDCRYQAEMRICWTPDKTGEELMAEFASVRNQEPRRRVSAHSHFGLPSRLWIRLVEAAGIEPADTWADLSKKKIARLVDELDRGSFWIDGKSTNKDEFVTCGGVDVGEINFKTMESKKCPGLFLAGEVLDIDGLTGGFNFQSAWTTGWIAGEALAKP